MPRLGNLEGFINSPFPPTEAPWPPELPTTLLPLINNPVAATLKVSTTDLFFSGLSLSSFGSILLLLLLLLLLLVFALLLPLLLSLRVESFFSLLPVREEGEELPNPNEGKNESVDNQANLSAAVPLF